MSNSSLKGASSAPSQSGAQKTPKETGFLKLKAEKRRQLLLKSLPFVLVLLLCLVQQSGVEAQGLVGAPVDVRYGQTSEVGRLADYGYDTARDISRLVTFVGFFTTLIRGFFSVRQKIKQSRQWLVRNASTRAAGMLVKRELGWTLLWLLAVPFVLHSLGTFAINNFGGLGGCCL